MEVARLLLDSGAQVNMPADSFESPLTLAACGGHVELAALLIERGANLEEVNDEGYTPLMEAAREGHEEMVALLLAQGETPWPWSLGRTRCDHASRCPVQIAVILLHPQSRAQTPTLLWG